ncbi:flagellar biosynthesis regulator FlaF [Nitrobacter winogradskyi]|uniref:Flagellar protein FlaF n=2 Tax=Nitrobacter winogradskyi TaxID=913 RepID=A0ACC6AH91_NITWI|nr:flagellar biosynthesis regulator FlaF [Nitrobacter winogradskyi]MCP1998888.1 flagellar protein FlaF [Nitrobacter winogradskyi]GEC14193.1 flagellar biosynthesis regulatory protein FlaF [Nitrobacter winogradskyi]
MSNAAQAYARTAQTSSSPREIEAQALLKAARQLREVQDKWDGPDNDMHKALLFNRRLWSIFMSAADSDSNPQPLEVRQNIANIGVFVMKQTVDMQLNPDPAKLTALIDINCNLAAGLSGRA